MKFTKGVERGHRQGERARQDFVSDCKAEQVPHRTSAKENQVRRAGNALRCQKCGKPLHAKRGSRRQLYCSYKCRDEARRSRNFAALACTRRGSQGIPRSVENQPLVSNGYKAYYVVRPPCIVGPALVIETEVIANRNWQSVVSPDGVTAQVARYRTRQWGAR